MEPLKMKYRYTEDGYCQVHFTTKHPEGHTLYYCLQEDFDIVSMYRCSEDGEAETIVWPKSKDAVIFEWPPDTYGQELLRRFLENLHE